MRCQVGVGPRHLRHPQEVDTPAGASQIARGDEAVQGARDLQRGGGPRGVVVGRRLRVAEMGHDQHLLVGLAGDQRRGALNLAVVEAGLHPGSHTDWPLPVFLALLDQRPQPVALAGREGEAEALRLMTRPPE